MTRFCAGQRRGFSLLEILLVTIILGVMAGLGAPAMVRAHARAQVRQAADDIVALMRYARLRAVTWREPVKVLFDDKEVRLMKVDPAGESVPLSGAMGRPYRIPAPVRLEGAPAAVLFSPDGRISPVSFRVSAQAGTFTVSTREIMGYVWLGEEPASP